MSDMHDMLRAIKSRERKMEPFAYGILTADRFVRTLQECVGLDACYRYAAKGRTSFDDLLQKAARTLVYSNADMVVEEKRANGKQDGVELPKNTLMTFRHVLTSSTKDRDGDTLHSDGALVDPKMLLLWQHVHTLPIGKMICVSDQNDKRLIVVSAIVDMNELCHDAAVMVDNDMGRFSHGFRATDFIETKADREGNGGGFDVKKFEIMEESLVSVPANVDAQTEEVLLSLVEGGKLTSPLLKQVGRGIREHRNVQVPGVEIKYKERSGDVEREIVCGSFDQLKMAADAGLIGGQKDENQSRSGSTKAEGAGEGVAGNASEKADGIADAEKKETTDKEMKCPECGATVMPDKDGNCPKCEALMEGAKAVMDDDDESDNSSEMELTTSAKPSEKSIDTPLSGSMEWAKGKLQTKALCYLIATGSGAAGDEIASIISTFKNYVLVCVQKWSATEPTGTGPVGLMEPVYYEVDWEMRDGEPEFSGVPRQVSIVVSAKALEQMMGMTNYIPTGGKPLPSEHTARQTDPSKYKKIRRQNNKFGEGVHAIWGVTEDGKAELQSIHFDVGKFTAEEAKKWLKDNKYSAGSFEEATTEKKSTKAGRVLSKSNETAIREAMDDMNEAAKMDGVPRGCKALINSAAGGLAKVLSSLGGEGQGGYNLGVKEAMVVFLTQSTDEHRKRMMGLLTAIDDCARQNRKTEQYRAIVVR